MQVVLIIVSILLIAIVLLQSGKAESASMLGSGSDALFSNRKERGVEVFISRATLGLGIVFFVVCLVLGF